MHEFIKKLAIFNAMMGGVVLTLLACLMSISIMGGAIAKLAYADFLFSHMPFLANFLQSLSIRTIPGMYEIFEFGLAFVIFAALPIAQYYRAHAQVNLFMDRFSPIINHLLLLIWEVIFSLLLWVMTWQVFQGMLRLQGSGMIYQDLQMPQWYGYALAFIQMILVSLVATYGAYQRLSRKGGREIDGI